MSDCRNILLKCPNSHKVLSFICEDELDDEDKFCDRCGGPNSIIEKDDIDDPKILIQMAQSELESANYHSVVDIPSVLWESIKEYIPSEMQVKVARKICDSFLDMI
jgi:hypothetical protein